MLAIPGLQAWSKFGLGLRPGAQAVIIEQQHTEKSLKNQIKNQIKNQAILKKSNNKSNKNQLFIENDEKIK